MRVVVGVGTGLIAARRRSCSPLLIGPDAGFVDLAPGLLVVGIGCGMFYPSITTAAVTALDAARASLAGGIVYMFQIAGGAVGLGRLDGDLHELLGEQARRPRASRGGRRR